MTDWSVVACALAAAAAALLAPARGHLLRGVPSERPPYVVGLLVLATVGVVLARDPRVLALAGITTAATASVIRLLGSHRADRAAERVRGRVVEMCEGLQAELAAGQTPSTALERAAEEWALLLPVVRTTSSGGDVPRALRALATTPGAGDLRVVAAAWQVAHRTGHGLGGALSRVAQELRESEQTRRVVTGELASARATARLVAALPLVALTMGSGAGADPWAFLLGEPLGLCCLAGGIGCGLAGLAWIEALARDVQRERTA